MVIGLTGGIASGKSTVAALFMKYGMPIVDADLVARQVVEPGKEAWKQIIAHFGQDILLPDQTIDRKKLGAIIFQDPVKRKKLNEMTHPIIISQILSNVRELQISYPHVMVDIPLLFESKREPLFDLIVVVYVDKDIQLQRLMEREQIEKEEALQKIKSQMSLEEKKEKADIVIYNDQGLEETEEQVKRCMKKWRRKLD